MKQRKQYLGRPDPDYINIHLVWLMKKSSCEANKQSMKHMVQLLSSVVKTCK